MKCKMMYGRTKNGWYAITIGTTDVYVSIHTKTKSELEYKVKTMFGWCTLVYRRDYV